MQTQKEVETTETSTKDSTKGRKVPALTKKEARDLGHLFPVDVQQRIAEAITKF